MSLQSGKKISLCLKDRGKIRGTVQLLRDIAGTYSLRVYAPQPCEGKRKVDMFVGIDLGYTEMMAASAWSGRNRFGKISYIYQR